MISSTASREPILDRDTVAAAIARRRRKPMFLVDIAVPRDIDPRSRPIEDVFLYTIDDLREVIDENLRGRREAAREAEAMIELCGRALHGLVASARSAQSGQRSARAAPKRTATKCWRRRRRCSRAAGPPDEVLAFLANTLTNKLLHAPSANLRAAALRGDAELLRAAERLFENDPALPGERES